MTTVTTHSARHIVFQLADASLPAALLGVLRDEVVLSGWVRASGVLRDVKIKAPGGTVRTLAGPLEVVVLDGAVVTTSGDPTCRVRAVLARENDLGALETIAGEVVEARIVTLDVTAIAYDDAVAPVAAPSSPIAAPAPAPVAAPPPPPAPSEPATPAEPPKPRPSPTFSGTAMPARPVKVQTQDDEQPYPDAGDVVEHFAFGRCEVVKSDGDRLHLRLGKDGRIKEIALEMLKVTPLPPVEGSTGKHYKLDRKL